MFQFIYLLQFLLSPSDAFSPIPISTISRRSSSESIQEVIHSPYYDSRKQQIPSFLLKSSTHDNDGASIEDSDDSDFYRSLNKAKRAKLGAPIPPEQLRESAIDSENEFLEAMRKTTQEFQEAKDELGSDGAVDLFLGRLRKEDEEKYVDDDHDDDDDKHNMGAN